MTSRVAFVTQEHRTVDKTDAAIRTRYPNAQVRVLTTNLDLTGALRRLDEELEAGGEARAFELVLEHIFTPDDFAGAPPVFNIYSPADGLNGEPFRVMEGSVDLLLGTTTVKVRG